MFDILIEETLRQGIIKQTTLALEKARLYYYGCRYIVLLQAM